MTAALSRVLGQRRAPDMLRNVALVVALAVLVAGCATDKLRANGYKAFGSYVLAEETAAAVVTNKSTPAPVVVKIQGIVKISAPAAEALYRDLTVYAALQDEIEGINAAGGEASAVLQVKLSLALKALEDTYAITLPKITELILAVNEFKRGGD